MCLSRHRNMAAHHPRITGAFLSAREANQRVDLNTLPADRRWKHISITYFIRVDDVYNSVPGDLAVGDSVDAKGTQWHHFGDRNNAPRGHLIKA